MYDLMPMHNWACIELKSEASQERTCIIGKSSHKSSFQSNREAPHPPLEAPGSKQGALQQISHCCYSFHPLCLCITLCLVLGGTRVCFFNSWSKMLTTRTHLVQVGHKTTLPPSLDIAFKDITLFTFFL